MRQKIDQRLAFLILLVMFPLCINAQIKNYSKADQLKKGLLQSMNIFYDPFTVPKFKFEWKESHDNYSIERFIIKQRNDFIPGYLLKPLEKEPPYPVMICLQGHSPGMYISLGVMQDKRDSVLIAGGRDLAIQAVNNGWAALVIEQKGFGERAIEGVSDGQLALRKLMEGNTLMGDRVNDVVQAINFIYTQPDLNPEIIGCMGNSTGGTVTYYASAIDPRIALSIVSCSFSTYESSWLKYDHDACGFLPGILKVGDMPDFAALIAPRKLIIVAGKKDHLADIDGVRKGFKIALESYQEQSASENIKLIEGEEGHKFYPTLVWPSIKDIMDF